MTLPLDGDDRACRHFGACGGCQMQDKPYADQLDIKRASLEAWFEPFWRARVEITPSPQRWHYRNKVDLNFSPQYYDEPPPSGFVRETVLGFRLKGQWRKPLEIHECLIGPLGIDGLLGSVRQWAASHGLRAFDTRTRQGLLKVLLVREGKRTGERMVVLVTRRGEIDVKSFVDAVMMSFPASSIQWAQSDANNDAAAADDIQVLHGTPYIFEELHLAGTSAPRRIRFRISPFSFFQTNTLAAERLYVIVRDHVATLAPRVVYDLYGGAGGIAFACADLVTRIESVDECKPATTDGVWNAQENGIDNVCFTTQRVKNYLLECRNAGGLATDSLVIVDPPRSGLTPKVVKRLLELGPDHIVYVSCNPRLLAREDFPALSPNYEIAALDAVDMFPHTDHVEVVALLRRRH